MTLQKVVQIRLSEAEREEWQRAADRQRMALAVWMRARLNQVAKLEAAGDAGSPSGPSSPAVVETAPAERTASQRNAALDAVFDRPLRGRS